MSRFTRFKSAVATISDAQIRSLLLPPAALEKSRLIIRRDSHQVCMEGFVGRRVVFRCGIRDRSLDGMGKKGKTSSLNHYPVNHELANALPHPDFRSAELSVYSYDLEQKLPRAQLAKFINDPDSFIFPWKNFRLARFMPLWSEALHSGLAPWQPVPPLKGFAQHFVFAAIELLRKLGYHRVEAVPGWYNAAVFFHHRMNFRFVNLEHEAAFELLERKLAELEEKRACRFNIREKSWIVALQNIPEFYLQHQFPDYYLGGIHWINSPTSSDYCARFCMDLNDFQPATF